jgi:hypothetical protein
MKIDIIKNENDFKILPFLYKWLSIKFWGKDEKSLLCVLNSRLISEEKDLDNYSFFYKTQFQNIELNKEKILNKILDWEIEIKTRVIWVLRNKTQQYIEIPLEKDLDKIIEKYWI